MQLEAGAAGWDVSAAENLAVPGAREQGHGTPMQTGQLGNLREAKMGNGTRALPGAVVIHGLAQTAVRLLCRECCGAATPRAQLGAAGAVSPRVGLHESLS